PGPLSLVLPRAPGFDHDLGGSSTRTVAVRVPACEVALELLGRVGPLAVTSANRSGGPPAHTAEEARRDLPGIEIVLDGGLRAGEVSTVLSLADEPVVLRPGAIPEAALIGALGTSTGGSALRGSRRRAPRT
ncbi:MAG: L-threonylcarbamoyladenylate synthase, partial [Actinomycetota bacterium]